MIGIIASSFDLLHPGHLLTLKEARRYCDSLIVLLHIDPSVEREGKNKPIESVFERLTRLESCRYVDKIIVYETEEELKIILTQYKNGIRFLGADYASTPERITGKEIMNIKFLDRSHNYSTTTLRNRIYEEELRKERN